MPKENIFSLQYRQKLLTLLFFSDTFYDFEERSLSKLGSYRNYYMHLNTFQFKIS